MILSTIKMRLEGYLPDMLWISAIAREESRSRKDMVSPLIPQNVQCCFCPHQQPRLVSYGSQASWAVVVLLLGRNSPSCSKYSSNSGVGSESISIQGWPRMILVGGSVPFCR